MKALAPLASLLLAAAFHAAAQAPGPLETRLAQQKVVTGADGRESLAAADTVRPGDVIEYTATYRNTGKQALRKLEATLPIPQNTELLPGTVRPATARASVDGRTFADMPLKRTVVRGGKQIQEDVPLREYRALRWYPDELGPDKTVAYAARVRVIDDRAAPQGDPKGGSR